MQVDNSISQSLEGFCSVSKNTVKQLYNDYPRDPKLVAVVDRWSFFKGIFMLRRLQNGGRCRQVVVNSGLTVLLNICTAKGHSSYDAVM